MYFAAYLKLYLRVFWRKYFCYVFSHNTQNRPEPQDSGKWRKSRATTQYAHFIITKWGLPKEESRRAMAMEAMRKVFLNILKGNRAAIVVRRP